jgi:D-3-phosphoglycerate dehydrogenase
MPAIFLDCTDDLIGLWHSIRRPGDPEIAVNFAAAQPENVPKLLAGYSTCIVDHSYFDAELLGSCPDLRRIVFLGTGASSFIDLAAAARHSIAVDTIKGYGDTTVAEHTLALVLASARDVAKMDRDVRVGGWRQMPGVQLKSKVLGIVGLGGIGREIARLGAGIGMEVRAWNRSPMPGTTIPLTSLDEVLATADILCVALALNEQTRSFLNREKLSRTKPGVIVVNTARADVIEADALVALLRSGHIRHAGIDVFSQEPPRPDDPLLSLDNVTLTAHAGFMTPEATMTMLRTAMDLVIAAET